MADEKAEDQIKVDVGLGLKASLTAKVSMEIPAASSGRLLDAITDIIRPFSERRGLKADLIRLEREEVAYHIARAVADRLQFNNQTPQPIPNKILVPLLEKASLEEMDSPLVDRWMDLLHSAAISPGDTLPRFGQMLSEMSATEVSVFRKICFNNSKIFQGTEHVCIDDCWYSYGDQFFDDDMREFLLTENNVDRIFYHFLNLCNRPGICLTYLSIDIKNEDERDSWELTKDEIIIDADIDRVHIDILKSLNLIVERSLSHAYGDYVIYMSFLYVTRLGVAFLRKCDLEFNAIMSRFV